MASYKAIVERASRSLTLNYSSKFAVGFGEYKGFTLLLHIFPNAANPKFVNLVLCAGQLGSRAEPSIIESKGLPKGVKYTSDGFRHTFRFKITGKSSTVVENIIGTADMAVSALSAAGYTNCSDKGTDGSSEVYTLKNEFIFLTAEEASEAQNDLINAKYEYDEIVENRILGTVGALVGSLAGVALILLIGRLGRVSVIGGLVMGIVSALGYKKLGGKLSIFGAVVCCVISAIMSYLSFRVDCALDLVSAFKDTELAADMTFGYCFANAKYIYEFADILSTYYQNMILMLLMGIGGAVASVIADFKNTQSKFVLVKLDSVR